MLPLISASFSKLNNIDLQRHLGGIVVLLLLDRITFSSLIDAGAR